jgi:hypothetical protein
VRYASTFPRDAKTSLRDAKTSLRDANRSVGNDERFARDWLRSLRDADGFERYGRQSPLDGVRTLRYNLQFNRDR